MPDGSWVMFRLKTLVFVPGSSNISAICAGNEIRISIEAPGSEFWTARFKGPEDAALQPQWYEISHGLNPELDDFGDMEIVGRGPGCDRRQGRFRVNAIDVQNGRINLFDATFIQFCNGHGESLYGDLRLENMASGSAASCRK